MKIKKSKLTIYILSSIAFISLVSVGFSSWVLDKIEDDSTNISAEIGLINDKSLIAQIDENASDLKPVCFDANSGNGGVVINGDSEVKEKMTFKIVYDLQGGYALNEGNILINFTFDDIAKKYTQYLDGKTQYIDTSCVKDCSIVLPQSNSTINNDTNSISSVITYTSGDFNSVHVESTFTFKWGDAFDGNNPCASHDKSVIETLYDFNAAFASIGTNKTFTVTITPFNNGAQNA